MKRRVAILISGRGSNMAALIEAASHREFPAEIVAVISNRADAGGLERARANGIPTVTIESKPFGKDRAAFEAVLQTALDRHRVELISSADSCGCSPPNSCSAGMAGCSTFILRCCRRFRASTRKARRCAPASRSPAPPCICHSETDAGPILMQGAVAVADHDTPETLAQRILVIEHRIYPNALRLLPAAERVSKAISAGSMAECRRYVDLAAAT